MVRQGISAAQIITYLTLHSHPQASCPPSHAPHPCLYVCPPPATPTSETLALGLPGAAEG